MGIFSKKDVLTEEIISKLKDYNFKDAVSADGNMAGETYNSYKEYFSDLSKKVEAIASVSADIEKNIESLKEVTNNTKCVSERIVSNDDNDFACDDVVDEFNDTVGSMDTTSSELLAMAKQMGEDNAKNKDIIKLLMDTQKKNEEVIESINNEIHAVLQKMDKIDEVTKVLYDISSQTNLLALNASIEAARAGEAGKGFAVVADEVRVLSDDSRQASEGINESVKDIATELDGLRKVLESSTEIFEQQSEAVGKVSEAMESISDRVDTFIDRQQEFSSQISTLDDQKEKMLSSISEQKVAKNANSFETINEIDDSQEELTAQIADAVGSLKNNVSSIQKDIAKIKL